VSSAPAPTQTRYDVPERVDLGRWSVLVETTKPGITRLVTITSMVGFALAALQRSWEPGTLYIAAVVCLVGTAMSAAGANAINQFMERDRDARMDRTMGRPIPSGRMAPKVVLTAGITLSVLGVGTLTMIGLMPSLVSLACVLSYVFLYTPLKPHSTLSTFVGAIPGGLPPLIGWTAATRTEGLASLTEPGGMSLVVLMLVWQIPHFLAIAWMYRADYAKGGYAVLPVIDPSGRWTAVVMTLWAGALIPATLWPALTAPSLLGVPYMVLACVTGLVYLALTLRLCQTRERADARRVFFASIIHLPLVLIAMVVEAVVRRVAHAG
jgi:heme o synthase